MGEALLHLAFCIPLAHKLRIYRHLTTMKPIRLGLGFIALSSVLSAADAVVEPAFNILSRSEIKTEGATITYALVEPPTDLPKRPVVSAPAQLQSTAVELAEAARLEAKEHIVLDVSAIVYLTEPVVTEIKLRCEDREYICYSNADFRDLRQTDKAPRITF